MGVRQAGGVEAGCEGVVGVQVGHAHQGIWDHGDGVGGHEGNVVWRAPQSERVVGQRGQAKCSLIAVPRFALMVCLVHLQRHDLLLGRVVANVVGGALALRAGLPMAGVLPPLVLAVVEGCESQYVEEQQRGSHSDCDTELCGVISRVLHHQRPRLLLVNPRVFVFTVVGRGHGRPLGVERPGGFPVGPLGGKGVLSGLWRGHFGGGGGVVEHVVEVVQVGH